jgi:hypothetical protein
MGAVGAIGAVGRGMQRQAEAGRGRQIQVLPLGMQAVLFLDFVCKTNVIIKVLKKH